MIPNCPKLGKYLRSLSFSLDCSEGAVFLNLVYLHIMVLSGQPAPCLKYLFPGISGCIFSSGTGVPVNPHVQRFQNMYGKGG